MRMKLRIAGSVALLAWLALRIDWSRLAASFAELHWPLWLAGVGLYLAVQVVSSLRWQLLARPLGFDASTSAYVRFTFISMFFGLFLPSIGSDVVRAWYLDAGSGRKRTAIWSVLLDRAIGLAVLLAMVVGVALLYPGELPGWVRATVLAATVGATVGAAALGAALMRPGRSAWRKRLRARALELRHQPRAVGGALGLSLLIQAGHVLVVWLIGLALGAPVPAAYYWIVVPLVSLVTLVPISINGIGVREASMVVLLAPFGVSEEVALSLVFLWFLAFTVAGAGGLVFYLLGAARAKPAQLRAMTEETPAAAPALSPAPPARRGPSGKYPFSLSMLGWALNEEQNIGAYIERAGTFLAALTDDYELILIDDASTDRTLAIARTYQQTRPWLRIHVNERNRGSGYNTKCAVALATKDYLFWQTADWAYDITQLGESFDYLAEYDVLQGVRLHTLSPAGVLRRSDNVAKAVISLTNYLLVRFLFRLPLHDYQNVTVYPRALIQPIELQSESAFTNPECLLKVWWQGARIKEIPVPFIKRQLGQANGTRFKVIRASIGDILNWWWQWMVLGRRRDHGRGIVHYWTETPRGDSVDAPADSRRAA